VAQKGGTMRSLCLLRAGIADNLRMEQIVWAPILLLVPTQDGCLLGPAATSVSFDTNGTAACFCDGAKLSWATVLLSQIQIQNGGTHTLFFRRGHRVP
jgi:hypothetical protein